MIRVAGEFDFLVRPMARLTEGAIRSGHHGRHRERSELPRRARSMLMSPPGVAPHASRWLEGGMRERVAGDWKC